MQSVEKIFVILLRGYNELNNLGTQYTHKYLREDLIITVRLTTLEQIFVSSILRSNILILNSNGFSYTKVYTPEWLEKKTPLQKKNLVF